MTAGPEAIHQLAADLIRLGHNAAVVCFPLLSLLIWKALHAIMFQRPSFQD
jgi:hypothetical protein